MSLPVPLRSPREHAVDADARYQQRQWVGGQNGGFFIRQFEVHHWLMPGIERQAPVDSHLVITGRGRAVLEGAAVVGRDVQGF